MFTGIITAIGTIREARNTGDLHAVITCPWDPAGIAIGASIACSGVCLTVVEKGALLYHAGREGWRLVYEHDPVTAWSHVELDAKGQARATPRGV